MSAEVAEFGASESRLRVRYAETDQMGIAHHGSYLPWFEVGRTDWLRERGRGQAGSYRQLEARGYFLPVIELRARYHWPARYDDGLVVRTSLVEASRARFIFQYEVLHEADGRLLARGQSQHAVTDGTGKARRLPAELLADILGRSGNDPAPEAPRAPSSDRARHGDKT